VLTLTLIVARSASATPHATFPATGSIQDDGGAGVWVSAIKPVASLVMSSCSAPATASLWLRDGGGPQSDLSQAASSSNEATPGSSASPGSDVSTTQPSQGNGAQPLHVGAVQYSDAYQTRRKIHKYASFATLPLFATEFALGQSMYNTTPGDTSGRRGIHATIGAGIIGLFALNTVTGAWNLFGEGWQDHQGRTLRLVHGLLMMAADAGFVAASQTGPNSSSPRRALTFETDKVTHRNIAIASMSVATGSYLLMLFGNR
jgi:hypothetical protein